MRAKMRFWLATATTRENALHESSTARRVICWFMSDFPAVFAEFAAFDGKEFQAAFLDIVFFSDEE
jgi:hypothetical protein